MQTDDTASAGNKAFMEKEEYHSAAFKRKEVQILTPDTPIEFNGAVITLHDGVYGITVPHHVGKMEYAGDTATYTAQRARGAYIAAICRPDLAILFGKAAQVTDPDDEDIKKLNKAIDKCRASPNVGLKYVPLKVNVKLAAFVDGSFADNMDLSSQLGFVTTLGDEEGNANVIHYGTSKSKRVTRSVLAVELYAMAVGFDVASAARPTIAEIMGRDVPLVVYTDSKSLYDALRTINTTMEKRLLFDLQVIRQAYEHQEITEVCWIPTDQNPADGMTKEKPNQALLQLMTENRLTITPNAWVERRAGDALMDEEKGKY